EFEQRKFIRFGNGVETTYEYDPQRRYLEHLQSAGKYGTFQNLSYSFDKVGNILSRVNDVNPVNGVGGKSTQNYHYDSLYRLTQATGSYTQGDGDDRYSLHMRYDGIHNIVNKAQVHARTGTDGVESLIKGTSYNWDYSYDSNKPHAATLIGERSFQYDANGNQLGWKDLSGSKQAGDRRIFWDDENRIQRINDPKYTSLFAYDDQGQRVVKYVKNNSANTAKTTFYVNQYYQLTNDVLVTKHVFIGSSRMLTKHHGGSIVFRTKARSTRSYDGRPKSNIPGNYKAEQKKETGNAGNGKSASAPGYIKKQERADRRNPNANNGNGNDKKNDRAKENANNDKGNGKFADGQHPGQGIYNRSDRANEVAQNVAKNRHLQHLVTDPDSPWYGDGQINGDDTTDGSNCNQINAGCTAGQTEIDQYTGEEVVVIGPADDQFFYYHPDHLGSTAYITDQNGDLKEHLEYFPFGETWVQEGGSKKTPYLYTSKEFDSETGLYYYGARYYDPRTSVWSSLDPILEKYLPTGDVEKDKNLPGIGGIYNSRNLGMYGYAAVNPVRYSDPDGNIIWGAIIGAGVEIASQLATNNGEIKDRNAIYVAAAVGLVTGGVGGRLATNAAKGAITSWQAVAGTAATSGISSGAGSAATDKLNGKEVDKDKAAVSAGFGLLGGFIGGKTANSTTAKLEELSAKGGLSSHVADTTNSAMIGKSAEKRTSGGQALGEAVPQFGLSLTQKKIEDVLE
ncbi:MAG: RHS repeat-associated core domain-containing protein, partial [Gammaproteobacteria bacterium]|nr:RHS repeat-associated core domain-containing protein [Gammaproteobacteria bacterium]